MDTLISTDDATILIDPYWLEIILSQTKKYFTEDELKDDELDDLYILFENNGQMYLTFKRKYISKKQFNIFYGYCMQAYKDYPNTHDAKAHFVDFRGSTWHKRNALNDYLDCKVIQELLEKGKKEGYFDGSEEKEIDFQDFVKTVLRWWKEFLDFLKENYGKPAIEKPIN